MRAKSRDEHGIQPRTCLSLHRPCLFRIPALVPKLLFGGAAELATEGQRAVPEKLREAGYEFKFPDIKGALADIFGS